jgi:hypothetical protein
MGYFRSDGQGFDNIIKTARATEARLNGGRFARALPDFRENAIIRGLRHGFGQACQASPSDSSDLIPENISHADPFHSCVQSGFALSATGGA